MTAQFAAAPPATRLTTPSLESPRGPSTSGVSPVEVERFHADGFCSAASLIPAEQALTYRQAALAVANDPQRMKYGEQPVFTQLVNLWLEHAELRSLTFHPAVIAAVAALARGRSMRLWHDHLLIKRPMNGVASEFHQDEPYWPIARDTFTISAWIALGDAPVERGCMSFIPGTHRRRDLRGQNLNDEHDLLSLWPELVYAPRVVLPVAAGGSTFHQGFTAHRAGPNQTSEDRVAMSIIWVADDAVFIGGDHPVTQDLGLAIGDTLPDHRCPRVC
jgi:phytanoyl-CoA hydroxylase